MSKNPNEKDIQFNDSNPEGFEGNAEALEAVPQGAPLNIKVTNISLLNEDNLLARANVVLNDCLSIRGVKIVNGKHGAFISMPSYQANGRFVEICFPTTSEFRQQMQDSVMGAYEQTLIQGQRAMENAKQA
ncbi:MAG: SpoVG family protein, partial [Bacilli bacterium]|nr:SpoVG family protein [Bacilli bacterium]